MGCPVHGRGEGGAVLTSPMTSPCPQLPRQALSLLFDTYHNEADAFLLADVSTDPGVALLPRASPHLSPPRPPGTSQP